MSEFVKKALTGYRAVTGQSDPECTHVILTIKEYDRLLEERATAKREKTVAETDARERVRRAERDAENRVNHITWAKDQEIQSIAARLEETQQEVEYQRKLNENLLRISKEQANADRKLKPKKGHTGYVVFSSAKKDYRFRVKGRRDMETVTIWETVMQTPFTVDFTSEQAEQQTSEDIRRVWDENGSLLARIGITYVYGKRYEEMAGEDWFAGEQDADNIMLNTSLKANYRTGYWELTVYHTRPLGIVPADMRAGVMGA